MDDCADGASCDALFLPGAAEEPLHILALEHRLFALYISMGALVRQAYSEAAFVACVFAFWMAL
jgi:hypothetical protein